jgi:predicted enzyme related to lactoylglutathione lyase
MSGTNAFTCSIEVADFDATAEKIAIAGGTVAMPKFAIPGLCWQGYFSDPDNNVFGIFQPDPGAR